MIDIIIVVIIVMVIIIVVIIIVIIMIVVIIMEVIMMALYGGRIREEVRRGWLDGSCMASPVRSWFNIYFGRIRYI